MIVSVETALLERPKSVFGVDDDQEVAERALRFIIANSESRTWERSVPLNDDASIPSEDETSS